MDNPAATSNPPTALRQECLAEPFIIISGHKSLVMALS
jgi:hypothetical protein